MDVLSTTSNCFPHTRSPFDTSLLYDPPHNQDTRKATQRRACARLDPLGAGAHLPYAPRQRSIALCFDLTSPQMINHLHPPTCSLYVSGKSLTQPRRTEPRVTPCIGTKLGLRARYHLIAQPPSDSRYRPLRVRQTCLGKLSMFSQRQDAVTTSARTRAAWLSTPALAILRSTRPPAMTRFLV